MGVFYNLGPEKDSVGEQQKLTKCQVLRRFILFLQQNTKANGGENPWVRIPPIFNIKKLPLIGSFLLIWARRDSNPRPKDYESSALPLRHRPVAKNINLSFALCLCLALAGCFAPALPFLSQNLTFSQLLLGRVPQARGV